jgi:hypothetical protein
MNNETPTTNTPDRLTVVVSRRIRPGREVEFEKKMQNFFGYQQGIMLKAIQAIRYPLAS